MSYTLLLFWITCNIILGDNDVKTKILQRIATPNTHKYKYVEIIYFGLYFVLPMSIMLMFSFKKYLISLLFTLIIYIIYAGIQAYLVSKDDDMKNHGWIINSLVVIGFTWIVVSVITTQ